MSQVFPLIARDLPVDLAQEFGDVDPLHPRWHQLVDVVVDAMVARDLPMVSQIPLLRLLDGRSLWSEAWRPGSVEPWAVRTQNVLRRVFATQPDGGRWADLSKLCPGEIMRFPNAGVKTRDDIVRMSVEVSGWIAGGQLIVGDLVEPVAPEGSRDAAEVVQMLAAVALPGLDTLARWASVVLPGASLETAVRMARERGAPDIVRGAANELMGVSISGLSGEPLPPREMCERLRDQFDEREWTILKHRRLVDPAQSRKLAVIAKDLGLTRERVRQLQVRALERLESLLESDDFVELSWRVERLRADLGAMVAANSETANTALRSALGDEQPGHDLRQFLLALAGPYRESDGWLELVTLDDLERRILSMADDEGLLPLNLYASLGDLGVVEQAREAVLGRCPHVKLVDGRFVAWRGSVVDKSVILLTLSGVPATAEELLEAMGEDRNLSSFRDRLRSDPRTMRVDLNRFGLRSWGVEEYSGIVPEILDRIERDGGRTRVSDLLDELPRLFGVSASSVRSYVNVPLFITEGDEVRLRGLHERVIIEATTRRLSGAFARGGRVSFILDVDSDSARGSGRPIAAGLSAAMGVQPGDDRRFRSEWGEIRVQWPVGSQQPGIGSIKDLCEALGALSGARLRLSVDTRLDTFEPRVIDEGLVRDGTLESIVSELVGIPRESGEDAEAFLCSLIGCPRASLESALSERREEQLLDAVRRTHRPSAGADDVADLLRILGA